MTRINRSEFGEQYAGLVHEGYGFVDPEAPAKWTARAIWSKGQSFDILPDRQTIVGEDEERRELAQWLNTKGIRTLNDGFIENHFDGRTDDVIAFVDHKFTIIGTPNASHGYAYIGAWMNEV